jgi:glutamyl-tRNA synthetase
LAPSPTGYLHLGHARTFWTARERARAAGGTLILRNDDLDQARVRPEFVSGFLEDLRWFGCEWSEGPDVGGPFGPYSQSERLPQYRAAFEQLKAGGFLYPCTCSRKDIVSALTAPHAADDEPIYPGTCRRGCNESPVKTLTNGRTKADENEIRPTPTSGFDEAVQGEGKRARARNRDVDSPLSSSPPAADGPSRIPSWRFQVPDGEVVEFVDGRLGPQRFVAGSDLGDFVVWRHDGLPSYQLACVVDDASMQITEVVRGADLLVSTARQLLLFRALGLNAPAFYHCPLVTDEQGVRLAKRHAALSLRSLREAGKKPEELR